MNANVAILDLASIIAARRVAVYTGYDWFSLADVDLSLEDAQGIVVSYVETISNPAALLAADEDIGEHTLDELEFAITEDTTDE